MKRLLARQYTAFDVQRPPAGPHPARVRYCYEGLALTLVLTCAAGASMLSASSAKTGAASINDDSAAASASSCRRDGSPGAEAAIACETASFVSQARLLILMLLRCTRRHRRARPSFWGKVAGLPVSSVAVRTEFMSRGLRLVVPEPARQAGLSQPRH